MAKIIIDSDNFVKTIGSMQCNMCPLNPFCEIDECGCDIDECSRYFKYLFGDYCSKLKVELKDGKDAIELK